MSFLAVLLLAGLLGPASESTEARVSREVTEAAARLEAGRPRRTLEICERLAAEPEFSSFPARVRERVWALLGFAATTAEDPEKAVSALQKALQVSPEEPVVGLRKQVVLDLARACIALSDAPGARLALERFALDGGGDSTASLLRAESYLLDQDAPRARAIFETLVGSARAAFSLGVIRFDQGDLERALTHFEEAARLEPQEYYTEIYRARTLLDLDRAAEAIRILEMLAENVDGGFKRTLPLKTPETLFLLGRAYTRQERFAEGVQLLRDAIRERPEYTEAYFALGTALRRLGKSEEARNALRRFQALHLADSRRLRALEVQTQVVLLHPADAAAREELARLALEAGDFEATLRYAWNALRLGSETGQARLTLARALLRTGRYNAAALHYQRFLRAHPGHATALKELEELVRQHSRK
jgi:tetratricopeptide (TPR) repeat protein